MTWMCSLPWTGFSNDPDGRVRPCCLHKGHITNEQGQPYYVQTTSVKDIFASKYMRDLRDEFRQGGKPVGCETCIKDESNGVKSKRMSYNHKLDYDQEPGLPVEYQMILSNACNLKCRSCTPSHSSMWQAEHKILFGHTGYSMPHSQAGQHESVLWSRRDEWMQHVKRLEIVGGEPFYIKQWPELWQELVEKGLSKNVDMDMSTNCTIYGGYILEKYIPYFKRIGIGLSIDGIGPMYDYLRHPGKWEEVEGHILKYKNLAAMFPKNFGISYTHTIGWLNAWYVPEFHQWVDINTPEFRIWDNIIHSPRHMSLVMMPQRAKDKIAAKWAQVNWGEYKDNIDGIIKFMMSEQPGDDEIRSEYKKFIINDVHRQESITSVIAPELLNEVGKYFYE